MSFRSKAACFAAFVALSITGLLSSEVSVAGELASAQVSATSVLSTNAWTTQGANIGAATGNGVELPGQVDSDTPDTESKSLDALVGEFASSKPRDEDMRCLAGAVYFEAKSESLEGQLAVARVVINRARSGRFADSLCGVVFQPGQFSFVRGRSMPSVNTSSEQWKTAVAIAEIGLADSWDSQAEGALFFHARHVSPRWKLRRIASIDNHIFYR